MASEDLKVYLEDRLRAIIPEIDLDPGSPAQVEFIDPVLRKLGTDPFETDIIAFMEDRFAQEYPDLYASDPGVIQELFGDPLRTLLEPFKREIQAIKINQSVQDPELLSDDDADALVSNWFQDRDQGGLAVGTVRVFFSNPTAVQVQGNRATTPSGLGFLPTGLPFMSAEEMAFNRSGSLFFMDIPYRAEEPGAEYNVGVGSITAVDGLFGVVKVTNPRKFTGGSPRQDTPTFVVQTEEALAEHSMVTRRGAFARSLKAFQGQIRAMQVVGARDPEMQRDLLVAASPGHAWLQGQVSLYEKIAYVQVHTIEGAEADAPVAGDSLFVYLSKTDFPAATQANRFIRFTVEEVLLGPIEETNPYQVSYLVRWSGTPPDGVTLPESGVYRGGFSKKGAVRISSLPDIGEVSLSVANAEVHVYGHSDVYLRPLLRETSTATFSGLSDDGPLVERSTLTTNGSDVANKNRVYDAGLNFATAGVEPDHVIIIETGDDIGVYTVRKVSTNYLYLNQNLSTSQSDLRYRVVKQISVNPFFPKNRKFPFGSTSANDLQTFIGSTLFKLQTNDLLVYGAEVGDTLKVLSGTDKGEFTITGFDSTLGGRGILVDRPAGGSNSSLSYEVFKSLEKVELPLVRVQQLLLLDSSEQSTGISVPPADPVGVIPTSSFSSARVRGSSLSKSGWVAPDLTGYLTAANVAAGSGDRRYSLGFDVSDGYYKPMEFADGTFSEFDYRSDSLGKCSWFVCPPESDDANENFPPINPKPGECLTIHSGPNSGSYLIRQVVKFKTRDAATKVHWYYFVQVYGEFPVDLFRQLISFLNDAGGAAEVVELPIAGSVAFPSFFTDLYDSLATKLNAAISALGGTAPGVNTCATAIESLLKVDYSWGDPARGVLRSYFAEPTLFEQRTGDSNSPTQYVFTTSSGEKIYFRPDPNRYVTQQIMPSRLDADAGTLELPRDLERVDASTAGFTTTTDPSALNQGALPGDILHVHEETFFFGSTKARQMAVQTTQGSNVVVADSSAESPFVADMVGSTLYIEEGADLGAYRVTEVRTDSELVLDRPLTESTSSYDKSGFGANWGFDGSINKIIASGTPFVAGDVGRWITIYGIDTSYQGSYKILTAPTSSTVSVERTGNFPAYPADAAIGRWAVSDAPVTSPDAVGSGTELLALRPVRMYEPLFRKYVISDVKFDDPAVSRVTIGAGLRDGHRQPYRIVRENVRRVTPTEMNTLREGPFYYFDTEVVSVSPSTASNIDERSYLVPLAGTFNSVGYRHSVDDPNLTYSMKESGKLILPTHVLPVGSEDSPSNFILLMNAPLQVNYERADLVSQFQDFLDSGEDRVVVANMLARHFLPTYVSYDAEYVGGSAPSVIAKDIQNYIDNIPIETAIDVSEVERQITKRGGNPETPTQVMVLIHDWDRKMWLEKSENKVGGTETQVPYNGTPKVSYFIAGIDVSGSSDIPEGERINLKQ